MSPEAFIFFISFWNWSHQRGFGHPNGLVATGPTSWYYSTTDKPEGWPGLCKDGKRQSPIALVSETAEWCVVEPLQFSNFQSFSGTVENNGHSIKICFDDDLHDSTVTGGMLTGTYVLHDLHFHWNSEHTVNGKRFPMELHLVHYSNRFDNFTEALHHHSQDALAVIGVLFEECETRTEVLDSFLELVKIVAAPDRLKERLPLHINPLDLLPQDRSCFYRYSGSLTTPECSEVVTWTVMSATVPISPEQIEVFKQVYIPGHDNENVGFNNRRLQDQNNRKVYFMSDKL